MPELRNFRRITGRYLANSNSSAFWEGGYAEWPCIIKKNVAYYYSLKEILDVTSYRNSSAAPEMAAVQNIRRVGKEIRMEKLELQKMANEVRKGIVTSVTLPKRDIRAVLCLLQIFLHTCILRR